METNVIKYQNLEILNDSSTLDLGSLANSDETNSSAAVAEVSHEDSADFLALSIDDLLPDAHGNVVICDEAGIKEMTIFSGDAMIKSGIAESHLTDGGLDVSGMAFYSFDTGVTLYLPSDVHISILSV
jgi:hypothetical protein